MFDFRYFLKNRIFKHKSQGSGISDLIATTLCLFALLLIMCGFVNFVKIVEVKKNINQIARNSVLMLETKGELTTTDIQQIYKAISEYGFRESDISISVNGKPVTKTSVPAHKVNFGQEVSINIRASISSRDLGLMRVIGTSDSYTFATEKVSTSKKK